MFRQAKSRIQALQIGMDDPTLLCTTERIGIDSKNQKGMLHEAPPSLIKVMFRQAGLRIQALQIDMDDPELLCTTERIGIYSKNQIKKACCTGLLQV